MITFHRTLSPNETAILEALANEDPYPHGWDLQRTPGINLKRIKREIQSRLNSPVSHRRELALQKELRQEALTLLDALERSPEQEKQTTLHKLQEYLARTKERIRPEKYVIIDPEDPLAHLLNILSRIHHKYSTPHTTPLKRAVEECCEPHYRINGVTLSDRAIERAVHRLQGIVSWKRNKSGVRYIEARVLPHVAINYVLPALRRPNHEIGITLEDGLHTEVLKYIVARTKELQDRYGTNFKPEFTRPEICRNVQGLPEQVHKFRDLMTGLEGILARVEVPDSFDASNSMFTVYYTSFSWFLPPMHQHLLEKENPDLKAARQVPQPLKESTPPQVYAQ